MVLSRLTSTTKIIRTRIKTGRLELIGLIIFICLVLNVISLNYIFQCPSSLDDEKPSPDFLRQNDNSPSEPISTIERSKKALEKLKILLNSEVSSNDQPWIWLPTVQYPSVPYQPTILKNYQAPKTIRNFSILPDSVKNEIDRVCQRLNKASKTAGEIWCKLFKKSYADTIATTTTLLDDGTTYIITGDIDLMWLRDSR